MANGVIGLRAVNNWEQVIGVRLRQALAASIQIIGRTGYEACKHAIIVMAQSARAMTKQSPKNRRVRKDEHGRYIEDMRKSSSRGGKPRKLYEWLWSKKINANDLGENLWIQNYIINKFPTFESAIPIRSRGLGKRSWMWGLSKFGKSTGSKPIPGVAYLNEILGEKNCGIILTNKLSYVQKAMPTGWEMIVQEKAGNKIMRQASMKLQRKWQSDVRRGTSTVITELATAFKGAA